MVGTVKGFAETLLVTVIRTRWRIRERANERLEPKTLLVRHGFSQSCRCRRQGGRGVFLGRESGRFGFVAGGVDDAVFFDDIDRTVFHRLRGVLRRSLWQICTLVGCLLLHTCKYGFS